MPFVSQAEYIRFGKAASTECPLPGTIPAVIGLLTWMWLSATIVLVGAELNSECERQTDRDTTKGPNADRNARS
jgi:uncharacterized BrkB/YihY/UPF0761 family membrane protein